MAVGNATRLGRQQDAKIKVPMRRLRLIGGRTSAQSRRDELPQEWHGLLQEVEAPDPPPLKWSGLRYGLRALKEDRDGEHETYA